MRVEDLHHKGNSGVGPRWGLNPFRRPASTLARRRGHGDPASVSRGQLRTDRCSSGSDPVRLRPRVAHGRGHEKRIRMGQ